jgi:excisionase family DNA binding protein
MLLEVKQAAPIANCSEKHIREMLRSGELEGVKLGSAWRVNRDALLRALGLAIA